MQDIRFQATLLKDKSLFFGFGILFLILWLSIILIGILYRVSVFPIISPLPIYSQSVITPLGVIYSGFMAFALTFELIFLERSWRFFTNTFYQTDKSFGHDRKPKCDDYDLRNYSLRRNKIIDHQSEPTNKFLAMESIDARIEILRRRSNAILLSIAGLLVCASFVIVFAGQLTNLDASASSNIDRLKSEVSSTKSKLGLLDQANDLLMQKDKLNNNDKDKDSISKQLQSLSSSYDNDFQLPMSMSAFTQLSITESDHLRTMEKLLDDAWSKDISTERGYDDTRYVIASAITRIGVVLVIVFLVQILIGLFRYNSRLVTFYSSRRDILQMWSGELKNFVTLESILAPKIDFGKEPKHPIDEIIQRIIQKVPTVPSVTGTDLK